MQSADPGQSSTRMNFIVTVLVLVVLAVSMMTYYLLPMTLVINEKTVLYEPDYLIKGIPAEFDGQEGDFFVDGIVCSRSSDACSVYSKTQHFEYKYPLNNSFIIVRTKPSLHVKLFINSPKARAAEQERSNLAPFISNASF